MNQQDRLIVGLLYLKGSEGVSALLIQRLLKLNNSGATRDYMKGFQQRIRRAEIGLVVTVSGNTYRYELAESVRDTVRDILLSERRDAFTPTKLEVLAFIAYKQPVSKSIIDKVRGRDSGHIIRWLIDNEYVAVSGRDRRGSNLLVTTTKFCNYFNITSLDQLPNLPWIQQVSGESDEQIDDPISSIE